MPVAAPKKMANFFPVAGDASFGAEFDCWHPEAAFGLEEQDGVSDWKSGTLTTIDAESNLPMVDLPAILLHMVKYCWEKASVSEGATRGPVQIGGARQSRLDAMAKSFDPREIMKQASLKLDAAKGVAPAVSPFNMGSLPHLQGVATDWKTMEQLDRVNAYTFRGDRRTPALIKADGGFNPPNSRTDAYYVDNVIYKQFDQYMQRRYKVKVSKATFDQAYSRQPAGSEGRKVLNNFCAWKALADNEAYHAGRMLASEALKGYISTSRAVPIAKNFAGCGGWVFVTRVRGGFLIPDKGKSEWTKIFGEQEIALPSALPWSDIFGFRMMAAKTKTFAGPVYLRKTFAAGNATAFAKCFDLLSGKKQ